MSVNHRHLKQTLNLHIVGHFGPKGPERFNLTAAYLDGLINWIMEEEAHNSRKGPAAVQTDAGAAHACVTLVKRRIFPFLPLRHLTQSLCLNQKKVTSGVRPSWRARRDPPREGHNSALCRAVPLQSPPTLRG